MMRPAASTWIASLLTAALCGADGRSEGLPEADRFRERVQPILETYCYGCHGYGASEGGPVLDEFASDEALVGNRDLWWAVLRNVRCRIMPPAGEERPSSEEWHGVEQWIMADVFGIDPADPDPGRVTLRRLNRTEYRNTIRDLMGVDYDTDANFPADDSGYGFDNIGDALSLSPLLMEKYIEAAETIVAEAVPMAAKVVAERTVEGREFRGDDGSTRGEEMSFYKPAKVAHKIHIDQAADYRLVIEARIDGYWEFDPGRCRVTCHFDGQRRFEHEYDWRDDLPLSYEIEGHLDAGDHPMSFEIAPLVSEEEKLKYLNFCIERIRVQGPLDESSWVPPKNYSRFFPQGPPPQGAAARDAYARDLLRDFTERAYRRPVNEATVDRLAAIAKYVYADSNEQFEEGVAQAMVPVLASPRFLFRIEEPAPAESGERFPPVDEYALASRLSYFLWSTMPDEKLLSLAKRGQLRANLAAQVDRMLADENSRNLVENFTGQWLQARDVEISVVDAVAALGFQEEWEALVEQFRSLRRERRGRRDRPSAQRREDQRRAEEKADDAGRLETDQDSDPDERKNADGEANKNESQDPQEAERERLFAEMRRLGALREKFSPEVRWAMRRETEMSFDYVIRENRNVLELLDSDYTFLNQTLAEHYGIPGVEGNQMRRVTLPEGSPRGGLLTQGTLLVVTSNPTRTSPVKRGLFVLDNILGTPAPPPPAAVPPLEASAGAITDHPPTLREALEKHRSEPLCAACHARMDPLGLALENFNAIGMWRDDERGQPIDTSGTLLTGEAFADVRELKRILKSEFRLDFYRCLTEKMLTYALGRGLEYYDEHTVEQIVHELDRQDGRFSVLLYGIIQSAPFQRQRLVAATPSSDQQARRDRSSMEEVTVP